LTLQILDYIFVLNASDNRQLPLLSNNYARCQNQEAVVIVNAIADLSWGSSCQRNYNGKNNVGNYTVNVTFLEDDRKSLDKYDPSDRNEARVWNFGKWVLNIV